MIRFKPGALVFAALILAAGSAFAQAAAPAGAATASAGSANEGHAGFVKSMQGTVRLVEPSGSQRALKSGDAVGATSKIETEVDSGASVVLRDGTVLVLGPSSQLDLKQFSLHATTHQGGLFVSLVRGSLRMITGLLGKKPETVRIDTQTATIGIRGTDFIVTAQDRL